MRWKIIENCSHSTNMANQPRLCKKKFAKSMWLELVVIYIGQLYLLPCRIQLIRGIHALEMLLCYHMFISYKKTSVRYSFTNLPTHRLIFELHTKFMQNYLCTDVIHINHYGFLCLLRSQKQLLNLKVHLNLDIFVSFTRTLL